MALETSVSVPDTKKTKVHKSNSSAHTATAMHAMVAESSPNLLRNLLRIFAESSPNLLRIFSESFANLVRIFCPPVHDPLGVEVLQPSGEAERQSEHRLHVQLAVEVGDEEVLQSAARHVLHHHAADVAVHLPRQRGGPGGMMLQVCGWVPPGSWVADKCGVTASLFFF